MVFVDDGDTVECQDHVTGANAGQCGGRWIVSGTVDFHDMGTHRSWQAQASGGFGIEVVIQFHSKISPSHATVRNQLLEDMFGKVAGNAAKS